MTALAAVILFSLLPPRPGLGFEIERVSRSLSGPSGSGRSSFLVVMKEQADLSAAAAIPDTQERRRFVYETLRAQADATQGLLRADLRQAGVNFRAFFLVNAIAVEGDSSLASVFRAREDVSHIAANSPFELSRHLKLEKKKNAGLDSVMPNLNLQIVRAPEVWSQGYRGEGVVVGVADTGFDWNHPALRNRYRGVEGSLVTHGYNWHDAIHSAASGNSCGSDSPVPCDDEGHGTAVAGLIAGSEPGQGPVGVAPEARLMGCRNMDRGVGTPASYIECFQFFLAPTDLNGQNPRPDLGADIINNSWGCPPSEGCADPNILRAVVENVRSAGIFVVSAAGNDGEGCSTIAYAPSIYEASMTVGATTLSDAIAGFSSRGPVASDGSNRLKPDLVAPGVDVLTSVLPSGYALVTGTSAAAPHVSGGVALLWSASPALRGKVLETSDLLQETAAPLLSDQSCGSYSGSFRPNPIFGWGRLDTAASLSRVLRPARGRVIPPVRRGTPRTVPGRD